jgi:hypothetical protein
MPQGRDHVRRPPPYRRLQSELLKSSRRRQESLPAAERLRSLSPSVRTQHQMLRSVARATPKVAAAGPVVGSLRPPKRRHWRRPLFRSGPIARWFIVCSSTTAPDCALGSNFLESHGKSGRPVQWSALGRLRSTPRRAAADPTPMAFTIDIA